MDIVRNFIKISGIVDEHELPSGIKGPIIQYSENETIFVPEDQPGIHSIFQVMLKVNIRSNRVVNTHMGMTCILDGVKKYKIIYAGNESSSKVCFLDTEIPYNTFIELPKDVVLNNANVYILDAYFSLLECRKIYSHILYLVSAETDSLRTTVEKDRNAESAKHIHFGDYDNNSEAVWKDVRVNLSNDKNPANNKADFNNGNNERNNDQSEILIDLDEEYL